MKAGLFEKDSAKAENPKWEEYIKRENPIYKKPGDIRSEFSRDYTRILHSTAYRRLKHKTQVFFATQNDHICTRIEHVNHVASVSYTISKYLGLNEELTNAIAIGHDLGHAPFGHAGEHILQNIVAKKIGDVFWHERNSLKFVDSIETLQDTEGYEQNLNLTYAVRDGIISHCGEVDDNSVFPRDQLMDLTTIKCANQYASYTWEGCVVKIADKISYLGRDIEDALLLGILTYTQLKELRKIIKVDIKEINNTILMHDFIMDLCQSSSPINGIKFSNKHLELIDLIKDFNYQNIYKHSRLSNFKEYAGLILNSIYNTLSSIYKGNDTLTNLDKERKFYPNLCSSFKLWIEKYSDISERNSKYKNSILYNLENEIEYHLAIVDYISGMTDQFSISIFKELTLF